VKHMFGWDDVTPGRLAGDLDSVRQRLYRLTITPPGELPQDPEWGLGIQSYLARGMDLQDLRMLEARARAAYRRDPDVLDASATIRITGPRRAQIDVQAQTKFGPLEFAREVSW